VHLQQTKDESRESGGPQYYLHDIPAHIKEFLRRRGACPVVLQTPYGLAGSAFMAVGRDHKLSKGNKPVPGNVGHDRIQQAGGEQSIGEAIRYWYGLKKGRDFEVVEVEAAVHPEGHFILIPLGVRMRGDKRVRRLEKVHAPLSFHRDHQSKLWKRQIDARRAECKEDVLWAASEIHRVVAEHRDAAAENILESDLLRTSGALMLLGLTLSPYLGKGYDCLRSRFQFSGLPVYCCPVEVKKRSSGFNYQITRYANLPRAVVLCMEHNFVNPPDHIDFIELPALGEYLSA
jgi:hypothetical protein